MIRSGVLSMSNIFSFFSFSVLHPPFFSDDFGGGALVRSSAPFTHQIGQLILLAIEENFSAMIKVKWVFYGMSANPLTALNGCK